MEDRVKARVPAEAAVVGLGVPLDEIDQGAGTLLARKHKLIKTKFSVADASVQTKSWLLSLSSFLPQTFSLEVRHT